MKRVIILIGALSALFVSSNVWASSETGKIIYFIARPSDNLHYFELNGEHADKPSCNGNVSQEYWMIKDENSAAGKTQISMLLIAYVTGKTISVVGTERCDRWSDGEDVKTLRFEIAP